LAAAGICGLTYDWKRRNYSPKELALHKLSWFDFCISNGIECPVLRVLQPEQIVLELLSETQHENSQYFAVAPVGGQRHAYFTCRRLTDSRYLAEILRKCPLAFLPLWQACMMAGGATSVEYTEEFRKLLFAAGSGGNQALVRQPAIPTVFGQVELTVHRDPVTISHLFVENVDGGLLIAFLARTNYGHALSGSVKHVCYVKGHSIRVGWFGAGGRGPTSKFANNFLAINSAFGTWTVMAENMDKVGRSHDILKEFASLDVEELRRTFTELVQGSTPWSQDFLHRFIVGLGAGNRLLSFGDRKKIKGSDD
jgi:hypothetical protein